MSLADREFITEMEKRVRKLTPEMVQAHPEIRVSPNACVICHTADADDPCAAMPCGHAVTPTGLAALISSLVTSNQHTIRCPALRDPSGDATLQTMLRNLDLQSSGAYCQAEWDYKLCRKIAVLNAEEKKWFEEKLSAVYETRILKSRSCPSCGFRYCPDPSQPMNYVRVQCMSCNDGTEFCWRCSKIWKLDNSKVLCGNVCCFNDITSVVQYLSECPTKMVSTMTVPISRACPKCAQDRVITLIQHDSGCKQVHCPTCSTYFCFACLQINFPVSCGGAHRACSAMIAPRQTRIQLQPKTIN